MSKYRSSVLTCDVAEDGCQVCDFLRGKLDIATLLRVIEILDAKLADTERAARLLRLFPFIASPLRADVETDRVTESLREDGK